MGKKLLFVLSFSGLILSIGNSASAMRSFMKFFRGISHERPNVAKELAGIGYPTDNFRNFVDREDQHGFSKFSYSKLVKCDVSGFCPMSDLSKIEIKFDRCRADGLYKIVPIVKAIWPKELKLVFPARIKTDVSINFSSHSRFCSDMPSDDVAFYFYELGRSLKDIRFRGPIIFRFDWAGFDWSSEHYDVFYKCVMIWCMDSFRSGFLGRDFPVTTNVGEDINPLKPMTIEPG